MKNKYIVNIGDRYDHYTVIEKLENNFWLCRCDCGKEKKFLNSVVHTLSMCNSCAKKLLWSNPDCKYHSAEFKQKHSEKMIKQWHDPNGKMLASHQTDSYKLQAAEHFKKFREDPDSKFNSPEFKETLATRAKEMWQRPGFRENQQETHKNELYRGMTVNEYAKAVSFFKYMHYRANSDYYKSKGRTVCDDWSYTARGIDNFITWLLSELSRLNLTLDDFNSMHNMELTVDRVNNDLGYSPDNCRLANMTQQNRNKSCSKRYNGEHILDIADRYDIPYKTMYEAYHNNTIPELLLNYQN